MLLRPSVKLVAGKVLAGLVVVGLGAFGGAALTLAGAGDRLEAEQATNRIAALGAPIPFSAGDSRDAVLAVEEAPRPAPEQFRPSSAPAVRLRTAAAGPPGAPTAPAPAPVVALPIAPAAPQNCDRLDDRKINWLLRLVARTRAANPSDAAVAGRLDAHLRTGLGKNLCAEQAQIQISTMCADPAIYSFMQKMVKELPFFVRPLVGDPCTQDLVKAAQKYLP